MHRIILSIKDIMIITGKGKCTAIKHMHLLKDILGKQKHQKITIKEYCRYEGIDYNEVKEHLKLK